MSIHVGKHSAGLLLFRTTSGRPEVLLVHPGGPFWAGRDEGAWSIPKGLLEPGEEALAAARREFAEETGFSIEAGAETIALPPVRQPGGKTVHAWAVRQDVDPAHLRSNTFSLEWPPRSGRQREFPEADRAGWFPLDLARRKILPGQRPLLEALAAALGAS